MLERHIRHGIRSGARKTALFWVALAVLALPEDAHAYLDPGTGSLIIQVVIGFFLAMGMTFKIWWRRSKRIVSRVLGLNKTPTDNGE